MALQWRPAKSSEGVVKCSGCGAAIARAEATVAEAPVRKLGHQGERTDVFACSPECEHAVEERQSLPTQPRSRRE